MISETFFASNYNSIWRTLAPTLDDFVRRTNMDGYTRIWHPLESNTPSGRRGLINEAAFVHFADAMKHPGKLDAYWASSEIGLSFDEARARLRGANDFQIEDTQSSDEEKEALDICGRLYKFFSEFEQSEIIVSPEFNGCGILNSCKGDVIFNGKNICEIKSGDRFFRSIDYRQVSIYCALMYAQSGITFDSISILNPRVGIMSQIGFSEFTHKASGNSPIDFCRNLIESFTARFNSN